MAEALSAVGKEGNTLANGIGQAKQRIGAYRFQASVIAATITSVQSKDIAVLIKPNWQLGIRPIKRLGKLTHPDGQEKHRAGLLLTH